MDDDYNWKRVDKPEESIEKMLPSGLAEYFFFDGESMIADLRVKGRDSASKLRKALYSMFDLDVIESAINHIGRTDLKTTVLGKLYLGKSSIGSGSEVSAIKTNIETAQNLIAQKTEQKKELREQYIATQAVVIQAFGRVGAFLFENYDCEEVESYIKKIELINWKRNSNDWKLRVIRNNGRMINNANAILLAGNIIKKYLDLPLTEDELTAEQKFLEI